nr:DeoR family transcriptional regulator [Actinomycetota bacterium]
MSEKRAVVPERRQQRIVELIRESGGVTVTALEREFGISSATARRDLAVLEQ